MVLAKRKRANLHGNVKEKAKFLEKSGVTSQRKWKFELVLENGKILGNKTHQETFWGIKSVRSVWMESRVNSEEGWEKKLSQTP